MEFKGYENYRATPSLQAPGFNFIHKNFPKKINKMALSFVRTFVTTEITHFSTTNTVLCVNLSRASK